MKIVMILNATFPKPLDIRVIKESTSLIEAGYDVTLLCLRDKNEPSEETLNGLKIKRINAGTTVYHLAFWDIVMSLTFTHYIFKKAISKILKENAIDAIHVHDLPLAGTALAFRKKYNIKIVVDLHENYADALRIWFKWKTNPLARIKNALFLRPERWEKYEKLAVQKADAVLTVVDEMKKRILDSHRVSEAKVTVISNTESKKFALQQVQPDVYQQFRGKFIIAYTGGIGPHRGVDTVIDAMKFLRDRKEIVFVVIGAGSSDAMRNLNDQIKMLGVENQVILLGHRPFNQVYSYMSLADVNIIPHKSNPQNEHGVPHKLFQSMMAAKPVLVSSCAPLKRIIEETQSGMVFQADNPEDCASKIIALIANEEQRKKFGLNGYKAATGIYSWEETGKKLVNVYKHA